MDPRPAAIDPEALRRDAAWLRELAGALARQDADADDLAQETWRSLLSARAPVRDLRAFAVRLATRLRGREARAHASRTEREQRAARREAVPAAGAIAERIELERRLLDELLALAEPYRTVLYLRYHEGLDARAIAHRTGATPATVRSRQSRGLVRLRERLEGTGGGRDWLEALAAFAARPAAPVPLLASARVTVGAAVVVSLLALAGTWHFAAPGASPDPLHAPTVALADGSSEREPTDDAERAGPRGEVASPRPGAGRAPAPATAPPPPATTLRARILDLDGAPLPGAMLAVPALGASARADADGNAEVALYGDSFFADETDPRAVGIEIRAEDHAAARAFVPLRRSTDAFAGTFHLAAGGTIEGRVVDRRGTAVEGAIVVVTAASDPLVEPSSPWLGPGAWAESWLDRPRAIPPNESELPRLDVARTDAAGRFRVDGLRRGPATVWARAPSRVWSIASPVAVGDAPAEALIELADSSPREWIEGRAALPDGAPAVHVPAILKQTLASGEIDRRRVGCLTGLGGRFALGVEPGCAPRRVAFRLDETTFVWFDAAPPGETLDVTLVPPRRLTVLARTDDGSRVHGGRVTLRPSGRAGWIRSGAPLDEARDGLGVARWTIDVPEEVFDLTLDADGWDAATRESLEPDALGDEIEIVLTERLAKHPVLRGRVLAADRPVAGARLQVVVGPFPRFTHVDPWSVRPASLTSPEGSRWALTDERGRFVLPLFEGFGRRPAPWALRVAKQGWASAVLDGDELADDSEIGELELRLTRGGAWEGRILAPDDVDLVRARAAIADGYGDEREVALDSEGRFRFDHLHPGPWLLRAFLPGRDEPVEVGGAKEQAPWHVRIEEGRTTRANGRVRPRDAPALLRGRLTVEGGAPGPWTVRVRPPDGTQGGDPVAIAPDGRFEARVEHRRRVELVLISCDARWPAIRITDRIRATPGAEPWALDLRFARISGRASVDDEPDLEERLVHQTSPRPGTWISTDLPLRADGTLGPTLVPAGRARLLATWSSSVATVNEVLAHLDLAEGEPFEIDVQTSR